FYHPALRHSVRTTLACAPRASSYRVQNRASRCPRFPLSFERTPRRALELRAQSVDYARIMRLDAALGTAHRMRRLSDAQAFEVAQHECLLLPMGQPRERSLHLTHRLLRGKLLEGLRPGIGHGLERVARVFVGARASRKPTQYLRSDFASSLEVSGAILEDAMEKRPPFVRRPSRIAPRELQHRVLHDIERIVVIAHDDPCDTKR